MAQLTFDERLDQVLPPPGRAHRFAGITPTPEHAWIGHCTCGHTTAPRDKDTAHDLLLEHFTPMIHVILLREACRRDPSLLDQIEAAKAGALWRD